MGGWGCHGKHAPAKPSLRSLRRGVPGGHEDVWALDGGPKVPSVLPVVAHGPLLEVHPKSPAAERVGAEKHEADGLLEVELLELRPRGARQLLQGPLVAELQARVEDELPATLRTLRRPLQGTKHSQHARQTRARCLPCSC